MSLGNRGVRLGLIFACVCVDKSMTLIHEEQRGVEILPGKTQILILLTNTHPNGHMGKNICKLNQWLKSVPRV